MLLLFSHTHTSVVEGISLIDYVVTTVMGTGRVSNSVYQWLHYLFQHANWSIHRRHQLLLQNRVHRFDWGVCYYDSNSHSTYARSDGSIFLRFCKDFITNMLRLSLQYLAAILRVILLKGLQGYHTTLRNYYLRNLTRCLCRTIQLSSQWHWFLRVRRCWFWQELHLYQAISFWFHTRCQRHKLNRSD